MDSDKILKTIMRLIETIAHLGEGEISEDSFLLGSDYLDSLKIVQLIEAIEDHFSIEIPSSYIKPDSFTHPRTVVQMVVVAMRGAEAENERI